MGFSCPAICDRDHVTILLRTIAAIVWTGYGYLTFLILVRRSTVIQPRGLTKPKACTATVTTFLRVCCVAFPGTLLKAENHAWSSLTVTSTKVAHLLEVPKNILTIWSRVA